MPKLEKAKTSCKFSKGAIILLIRKIGINKTKKIVNTVKISGLGGDLVFDYLIDEHNWILFDEMINLLKKIKDEIKDENFERDIIKMILRGEVDMPYLLLQKTSTIKQPHGNKNNLIKNLSTYLSSFLFSSPSVIYKATPQIVKMLSKNNGKVIAKIKKNKGRIFYVYNKLVREQVIGVICDLNKFALKFTPTALNLSEAQVFEKFCCRNIENILLKELPKKIHKDIEYHFERNNLFINGKKYGKKYKFRDDISNKESEGILITEDFFIGENKILEQGKIYNSPYCAYEIKWKAHKPIFLYYFIIGLFLICFLILFFYFFQFNFTFLIILSSFGILIGFSALGLFISQSKKYKDSLDLLKDQDKAIKESYNKLEKQNIQLEKKVEARTAELKRLNQAQTDFLLNIAHSLQSPLAITKGNLEMINEEIMNRKKKVASDKRVMGYSNIINKATTRLSALINDLLELARMDFGKLKLNKEPVNMNEMLAEMQEEYEILALDKNLKFDFKLPKKKIILNIDKRYFKEAISNLLSNSLKYTNEGGIEVALSQKGKSAIISVKDTGIGIPADEVKNMFKKFFRASNVPRTRGAGTGLGMSIVKWIVENHKGRLTFQTKENKGSTFTIEIPINIKKENNEK